MRIVNTNISYGYLLLLEIFAKANGLVLTFERTRTDIETHPDLPNREYITILYEENSDTDMSITFMSVRHLGFENMLCDYLIRCGIDSSLISVGKFFIKRSEDQMEKDWQEHRKLIGLI